MFRRFATVVFTSIAVMSPVVVFAQTEQASLFETSPASFPSEIAPPVWPPAADATVHPLVPRVTVALTAVQRGTLHSLAWSHVALQSMDFITTRRAISAGGAETNPVLRSVVGRPLAFAAVKGAATWGILRGAASLRKRNPRAALFLLTAINSAYAAVVVHNYRAGTLAREHAR